MRLFLIDGTSFCYRAFYAIKSLSTSKGQPTNAIYGVITMLKKLTEEEQPEYLGVAFDLPGPTFRHQRFEAYKEHRQPMPDALSSQIPWIKELLKALRVPIFEEAGYEADDLLGSLTFRAKKLGLEVLLVTGDKDLFQLVGPQVKVYRPTREGHEIIDEEGLLRLWRVRPDQVVDVMALMGDKIDAIPGVPGIGEKTAVELIQRFGSVEGLLKNLEEVPGMARRQMIAQNTEQLNLSRELASLNTEVPVDLDLERLKRTEPDREALLKLFQTLEFRTLVKELLPKVQTLPLEVKSLEAGDIPKILAQIRPKGRVAVAAALDSDLEGEDALKVGLAWDEERTMREVRAASGKTGLRLLQVLSEELALLKICPDMKETLVILDRAGFPLPKVSDFKGSWTDPGLASYLIDPSRPSHRMGPLAMEFLGESMEYPDPAQSAAAAAGSALRLMPRFEEEIEKTGQTRLLTEVEIPLSLVLARMESAGIGVDLGRLARLSEEMDRTLTGMTEEIYRQTGGPFNLNSPKQLAEVLFEKLKLPVLKRTKTGASTDEGVLRRLSKMHPLPAMILEYREMFKLKSTYVDALPKLVDPKTKRIHTSFNQTVTATGRLSSSDPNLQNIPIRTELGRQIRRAFVPVDDAHVFLAADYSQIELRILAHLSGDEQLTESFRKQEDIHRVTAAEIFSVDPESVVSQQRAVAKTINFGIIYGMSPFGLAKELEIDPAEAEAFIQRYFARYHGVHQFLIRSLDEARERGYSTTLLNRRRTIPELKSKEIALRQFAERTAINTPIQGSAADLIKVVMVALDEALLSKGLKSRMLLQVHDELIFEVPEKELEPMKSLVKEMMEAPVFLGKPIRLSVPIEVNLKVGRNWLEASHG
ncbi:MAG: DNA polymerase I [Candidatus Omnitrophica bacterium]|nr:DNA polymerase I [Candidatus Omnitrophota bacterium]